MLDLERRFWEKVDKNSSGGCWLWGAYVRPNGYGQFKAGHRVVKAHRFAYELLVGPIPAETPDGQRAVLDHLCRVRRCVNPAHLEVVSHAENCLRGESLNAKNARKTHCVHGHEFDDANTYVTKLGRRRCRRCRRDGMRRAALMRRHP